MKYSTQRGSWSQPNWKVDCDHSSSERTDRRRTTDKHGLFEYAPKVLLEAWELRYSAPLLPLPPAPPTEPFPPADRPRNNRLPVQPGMQILLQCSAVGIALGRLIRAAAFDPSGRYLATANGSGAIYILRLKEWNPENERG